MNWNGTTPLSKLGVFVWVSHGLLPQKYSTQYSNFSTMIPSEIGESFNTAPDVVDDAPYTGAISDRFTVLKIITTTHLTFSKRAAAINLFQIVTASAKQLDAVLDDFERFLNLGVTWRLQNYCPTLPIDLIWHATMTSPRFYNTMCFKFFGRLLPHCLEENDGQHEIRFADFLKRFQSFHQREPIKIVDMNSVREDGDVYHLLAQQYVEQIEREKALERQEQEKLALQKRQEEEQRERERIAWQFAAKKREAEEKARAEAAIRAYNRMSPQQRAVYDWQKKKEEEEKKRQSSYSSYEDSQC